MTTGSTRKKKRTNNVAVDKKFISNEQNDIWSVTNGLQKTMKQSTTYTEHITEPCCVNNSLSVDWRWTCCILMSQPLQWDSTTLPACYIVGRNRCSSDGPTSRIRQEWNQVAAEATTVPWTRNTISTVVTSYKSADWMITLSVLRCCLVGCNMQCCHISLKKRLWPCMYTDMNVYACLYV
jgi:hypothetical protein